MNDYLGLSFCHSAEGACPLLMGFPGGPPGFVPGVEPGEDRPRSLYSHLADGALFAAVDLLDDECTPCGGPEIGIGGICGFHFCLLLLFFDFVY